MRNPFIDRVDKIKKIGGAGRKAENSFASRIRGEQTLASGAKDSDKGDVKVVREVHKFLMEVKSTQNESMSLKLLWLLKIAQEALESKTEPAVAIIFTNDHGVTLKNGSWVLVREDKFKELIGD